MSSIHKEGKITLSGHIGGTYYLQDNISDYLESILSKATRYYVLNNTIAKEQNSTIKNNLNRGFGDKNEF